MEDKISFYTSRSDNYSFISSGYITTNIIARLPVFSFQWKNIAKTLPMAK